LDPLNPSLKLQKGVGSRPQAVDLAHPAASVGAIGTDNSAQNWDEFRPLLEQERPPQYTTTTATTQHNLSQSQNQDTTILYATWDKQTDGQTPERCFTRPS